MIIFKKYQYKTSKDRNSFLNFLVLILTSSTRAFAGPMLDHSTTVFTDSLSPSSNTSTRPSSKFLTQPVMLFFLAIT